MTVLTAIRVQRRVMGALILRETKTRYGDYKLGYLWAVLEPVLFVSVFVGIFALIGRSSVSGMPVTQFMLTGITPFLIFRKTMQQTNNAIESNRALLTFPQVTSFDLILARALLEIATMGVVFVLLLAISNGLGFSINVVDPIGVLTALLLLGLMGWGFGAGLAALRPLFPSIQQMADVVMGRPLFLSSGVFFTAEMLPSSVREILLYNPLLHIIEMLRTAFFVEFESRYADPGYALTWATAVLAVGLLIHRALRRQVLKK